MSVVDLFDAGIRKNASYALKRIQIDSLLQFFPDYSKFVLSHSLKVFNVHHMPRKNGHIVYIVYILASMPNK